MTPNSSPPEPGGQVVGAQGRLDALGHRDQHLVAGAVAVAVVDRLEAVEVEVEHGDEAPGPVQLAGQALEELGPVGQVRSGCRGGRRARAAPGSGAARGPGPPAGRPARRRPARRAMAARDACARR